ncbi:MAG: hypothetical protein ACEQSK_06885 [Sphingomonadaceae bacterium]
MLRDLIKPYIPEIVSREVTNRALARVLGVSEHHLCRTLKAMGIVRNPAPSRANHTALLAARKSLRTELANSKTVAEAARIAGCSERTIYRLRTKNGT